MANGPITSRILPGWLASGPVCVMAKKVWAASHMASGRAVTLNMTRVHMPDLIVSGSRSDIASASNITLTVPAAGPNSRAAAIVNVSEIEKLIWTLRIRNGDHAVTIVSASRTNQDEPTGCRINSAIDKTRTRAPAASTTR